MVLGGGGRGVAYMDGCKWGRGGNGVDWSWRRETRGLQGMAGRGWLVLAVVLAVVLVVVGLVVGLGALAVLVGLAGLVGLVGLAVLVGFVGLVGLVVVVFGASRWRWAGAEALRRRVVGAGKGKWTKVRATLQRTGSKGKGGSGLGGV